MREVLRRMRCLALCGSTGLATFAGAPAPSPVAAGVSAVAHAPYGEGTFDGESDDDSCPVEENGFTGILRVDYMFDTTAFGADATVLITSDEEYAQITRKLSCHADGVGLVKLEGAAEWTLRLRLDTDGLRLAGQCQTSKRRVYVVPQSQASNWL